MLVVLKQLGVMTINGKMATPMSFRDTQVVGASPRRHWHEYAAQVDRNAAIVAGIDCMC
jgi:hypothetical protein